MNETHKTFKLKSLNIFFLMAIGLLCIFLILSTGNLALTFSKYVKLAEQYAAVSEAALDLQTSSDYLTEETRLFVLTYDIKHINNYFKEVKETKRRDNAIEKIKTAAEGTHSFYLLQGALLESVALEKIEYTAMKLVIEGHHYLKDELAFVPQEILDIELSAEDAKLSDDYKISKAWLLLFSKDYLNAKLRISNLKSNAITEILNQTESAHDKSLKDLKTIFYWLLICIAGVFITNLTFFIGILRLIIGPLYSFISNIKNHKKLSKTRTKELNILSSTYNEMFDKNEANELLLKHKAEHDELTNLLNRHAYEQLKTVLSSVEENIAFLIIDVDHFKQINDTKGHSVGDKVLKKVADTLSQNFRAMDYVMRVGGDEFCVIMTQCSSDSAATQQLITTKLTAILKKLSQSEKDIPSITLSCGIAFSKTGWSEKLYENADKALYSVKRGGRNGFAFAVN